jgi:hypothetical protein
MNVNERDRRDSAAGREGVQRTPRSGGRTTAQRATPDTSRTARTPDAKRTADAGGRDARRYPTQGSAALRVDEPARARQRSAVRDTPAPRLKVAPPPPVAAPRAPFVALVLLVVVAGVLGILMINTKTNENAFRLDELQKQQTSLDLKEQQLKQEIARNEDPGNLTAQARRLGLVDPGPPAFIRLPDGKVIGVPKPAVGQPSITSQQGAGR